MALKFCRALLYETGATNVAKVSHAMKFIYEFWGFCVNGGSSLIAGGGWYGNTTIAAGSNGASLPQATINVVSTTGFPATGTIFVLTSTGTYPVTYTGTTTTSFTGCNTVVGAQGTGTMSTGGSVNSAATTTMPGNFNGAATTIAVASNGVSLPTGTINVIGTVGFPASGTINVFTSAGTQTVAYTGTTGTTFTGCTGGTGTMSTNGNVTSGSLMTIGTDGYTNATTEFRMDGYHDFFASSGPFTSSMLGKTITIWKPNSGTSQDSVYKIIAFKSATNIVINVNNGGTPSIVDGYKPSFTSRTSINYRVNDIHAAAQTTADGNYYVMQLDPTGINTGQANSQLRLTIAGSQFNMQAQLSPAGTWNGTAFTDGTNTINPNYNGTIMVGSTGSNLIMNMIADKDFLIYHNAWQGATYHNWMHVEIPERLYTVAQDPNPIAISLNGYNTSDNIPFSTGQTNAGYGGGFQMKTHSSDGAATVRLHRMTVKALIGDGNTSLMVSPANTPNIPGSALTDFRAGANTINGKLLNSSGFLTLPGVINQYSYARCRLRRVRFANTFMKQFTRFESNGDFILMQNGAALPWDKTVLPYTIFLITG